MSRDLTDTSTAVVVRTVGLMQGASIDLAVGDLLRGDGESESFDATDLASLTRVQFANRASALVAHQAREPAHSQSPTTRREGFLFCGSAYSASLRRVPYTHKHLVVSSSDRAQSDLGANQVALFLALARICGPTHEVFYNGVAPTWDRLHFQCILRRTTIFDSPPNAWPAQFWMLSGCDEIPLARELQACVQGTVQKSDLLTRYDDSAWRVAVIPRQAGSLRPRNRLGNPQDFGTFGVLEMAGFFVAARNKRAAGVVTRHPSLYEQALHELSGARLVGDSG